MMYKIAVINGWNIGGHLCDVSTFMCFISHLLRNKKSVPGFSDNHFLFLDFIISIHVHNAFGVISIYIMDKEMLINTFKIFTPYFISFYLKVRSLFIVHMNLKSYIQYIIDWNKTLGICVNFKKITHAGKQIYNFRNRI